MPTIAVTVVGHDRPGIVHTVTGAIAEVSGNLEDSSMSLLRGHFAMTLVADVPAGAVSRLRDMLAPLRDSGLAVSVLPMPAEASHLPGIQAVLSVHGADRPGIVHAATGVIADSGGNITDLSTRLREHLYVLTADVTFPPDVDLAAVSARLTERMSELDVRASLRLVDEDVL
jgi:glycine cleavage system transcriptional repressor